MVDNNKYFGFYTKKSPEAYEKLIEEGYEYYGKVEGDYYRMYGGREFRATNDISESIEVELKDGEFVEVRE